jgi:hypothetical protein
MLKNFAVALLLLSALSSIAQTKLFVPRNLQATYAKGTRSADGKPGPNYWQNTADYVLNVKFDPLSRYLNGTVDITYYNNSPDTLKEIWFKLFPNLYKKGTPVQVKISPDDQGEGVVIEKISINGKAAAEEARQDGTNMTLNIEPLLPKQSIQFSISYNYTLNKGSHNRTGEIESGSAFIAYFFPRIAVYDDVDGWNKNPYVGTQEFYNDFCNFKANISVPSGFVVWATGDLRNCNEVLNPIYCERIQQAEASDAVINIIDSADLVKGSITATKPTNTWQFEASNVTDFVFALSDHYLWKSSSLVVDQATGKRTRVDAVFSARHEDYYEVIDFARKTVEAMSYRFPKWPFPYSHETVFDGLDQMEYPMMVNDNPVDTRTDAITLTDHEIFHTIFPFYMGINETKYAWMDEGWATLGEWLISAMIDPTIDDDYGMKRYDKNGGTENDLPIITPTTQLANEAMFLNSYAKPAMGYLYVKDMLGESLFTKALHFYITQWQGKHPMPYDFFNSMNTGSGKDLNWFWQRWFFDNGAPDLAIEKVKNKKTNYTVVIRSKGTKPVPIDLVLHYSDASTTTIHRDVSCWQKKNETVTLNFTEERPIIRFTLGSTHIPDINKADNVYLVSKP